jgi:4-hydroxybenzoate polyprenyltransferase
MKTTRFQTFVADMEDLGRKCNRAVRTGARSLATLSWPALLAVSIVLAILLSLVPLVLTLFIGLLLFMLVATAIFGRRPQQIVE